MKAGESRPNPPTASGRRREPLGKTAKQEGANRMRPVVGDTPYKHIFIMDDGRAMIGGTRIKVEYIVACDRDGMDAKAIKEESYPSLTMGQVYSALAYYCDNKAQIEDGDRYVEKMRAKLDPFQPGRRERLLARRRNPMAGMVE